MLALLSPRMWIAAAIAAALAFSHFYVYRMGKNNVRLEWQAATAQANDEARKMEQKRQAGVDDAAKLGASRQAGIRADSARVGDAVSGLRDAFNARHLAEESAAAATERAATAEKLLVESAGAYRELAETCDRHVSDLRMLIDAWPK